LQDSRSFPAVRFKHDPSSAIMDSEARSVLTSQLSRSAAIRGDIDIGKSIPREGYVPSDRTDSN
jgi:hypothetical protein